MAPSVASPISTPQSPPVKIHPKPTSGHPSRHLSMGHPSRIKMYNNAVHVSKQDINASTLENISTDSITHVYYASASFGKDGRICLDERDTNVQIGDTRGALRAVTDLRKRNPIIKIILSIGDGSKESLEAYSCIAWDHSTRETFARTAHQLVDIYQLDGIDIAWDSIKTSHDANNYILLLRYMRDQFPEGERILTSSISFNTHIDFNAAATLIDLINLKCFDFTCPLWSKVVGYGSQTYSSEGADFSNGSGSLTCHSAIVNLKVQSVPPSKIMLGIPTFGWGFIGATRAGEDYKNYGRGRKFCYSELPPSRELDNTAKTCWARGIDNCFVSYDNPWSVGIKAELVKSNNLAGLVFWEATGDHATSDFSIVRAGWRCLLPDGSHENGAREAD